MKRRFEYTPAQIDRILKHAPRQTTRRRAELEDYFHRVFYVVFNPRAWDRKGAEYARRRADGIRAVLDAIALIERIPAGNVAAGLAPQLFDGDERQVDEFADRVDAAVADAMPSLTRLREEFRFALEGAEARVVEIDGIPAMAPNEQPYRWYIANAVQRHWVWCGGEVDQSDGFRYFFEECARPVLEDPDVLSVTRAKWTPSMFDTHVRAEMAKAGQKGKRGPARQL